MAIQILIHQICRCEYESVQVAIPFSNSNKYVFYSLLTIPQSFSSASSSLSVGSTKNSNSHKSKRLPCSKNTSEDCGNHHASSKIMSVNHLNFLTEPLHPSNLGIFSSNHRVAAGTLARARSCTGTPEGAAGAAAAAAAGAAAAGAEAVEAPRSWATGAIAEDEAPERLRTASQTSAGETLNRFFGCTTIFSLRVMPAYPTGPLGCKIQLPQRPSSHGFTNFGSSAAVLHDFTAIVSHD